VQVKLHDEAGTILLSRHQGQYYATGNKCTHASGQLIKVDGAVEATHTSLHDKHISPVVCNV
jgi:nitrite reductase/ring-hydroxylating ferredoxin subunit